MFKDGVINPDAAMYKFFVDRGLENDPLTQDLIDILTPYSKQATNMQETFLDASGFNLDINNWDTQNVTNMSSMFRGAVAFNQDLNTWQIEKVSNMNKMFEQAEIFDQNLSAWVVWFADPKPTIVEMFEAATVFNNGTSGSGNSQAMRGAWSTSLGGPYSAGELDAAYIYPF